MSYEKSIEKMHNLIMTIADSHYKNKKPFTSFDITLLSKEEVLDCMHFEECSEGALYLYINSQIKWLIKELNNKP